MKGKKKYLLFRLWRYLGRYHLLIAAGLVLMFSSNVLALLGPRLSGRAIDAIGIRAGGVDFERVFYYTGWRCSMCCRPFCPICCLCLRSI